VDSPFERYSRENGVRMSMLGEDLVVGFRGTCTVWDLLSDLRIGTVKGPYDAKVHKGFHRILRTIDRGGVFLEEIRAAAAAHGAKRVVFTGYSLGGAVACLALLEHGDALLSAGIDVRCITFGCPRLADNNDLHKLPRRLTTRIVHTYVEGDPIPLSLTSLVPWHRVNYVHVGNAVVIEDKGTALHVQEEGDRQTADTSIKWYIPSLFFLLRPVPFLSASVASCRPSLVPPPLSCAGRCTGGASRRPRGRTTSRSRTNATSSCSPSNSISS